jgi:hypothetical protein
MAQLVEPALRPVFAERAAQTLGAHPAPGLGDVDRAIRGASGCGSRRQSRRLRTPRVGIARPGSIGSKRERRKAEPRTACQLSARRRLARRRGPARSAAAPDRHSA